MWKGGGAAFLVAITGLACGGGGYGGSGSKGGSVTSTTTLVQAQAGSGQSAATGADFATALKAYVFTQQVVDDGYGASYMVNSPKVGATVTFTIVAGGTGAGGSFPGPVATATGTTDAAGNASAPTLTANGTAGTFTVTATVSGASGPATFTLTNL
jgi:hypothetical protein